MSSVIETPPSFPISPETGGNQADVMSELSDVSDVEDDFDEDDFDDEFDDDFEEEIEDEYDLENDEIADDTFGTKPQRDDDEDTPADPKK